MKRYIQPRKAPTRKVAFGTAGAAVAGSGGAVALIWVGSLLGFDIPLPVAVFACGVIGSFLGGYFSTERLQGT